MTGKAPGAAVVRIFDGAGCRGDIVASGSPAQFAAGGIPVQVADNTTTSFYGVSVDGGGDRSSCSSDAAVYSEDSTAPHARFTSGPGASTRKHKVLFRFVDARAVNRGPTSSAASTTASGRPAARP